MMMAYLMEQDWNPFQEGTQDGHELGGEHVVPDHDVTGPIPEIQPAALEVVHRKHLA
jgi:hypothetical protein